jgi:Amidohydrolase
MLDRAAPKETSLPELPEITAATDTSPPRAPAAIQAQSHDDYELIVDVDAHLQEGGFWPEIIDLLGNDLLKQTAQAMLRPGSLPLINMQPGMSFQALAGRVPHQSGYNLIHMTNWIINAMPERYPKMKVMWVESGLAWVPFLMQRLDHEVMMRQSEAPGLKRLPSEYMREMYYSSQPLERNDLELLEMTMRKINAQTQLLFASDWPHWDFDPPSAITDLAVSERPGQAQYSRAECGARVQSAGQAFAATRQGRDGRPRRGGCGVSAAACVAQFVTLAEQDLARPADDEISDQELAAVLTAAVRLYALRCEVRDTFPPPLLAEKVTATDVATVVSEMIRVADLNMFDLSMWHGRPRPQQG